jgi:hypothetical protein
MSTLTVTECARTGLALALSGGTAAANGDQWLNTGREVLVITNGDSGAHNVSVDVQAEPDGKEVTERQVSVVNATTKVLGPFPPNIYNDAGGYAHITYAALTAMKVQVVRIPTS